MRKYSDEDTKELATMIANNIKDGFEKKHLSGNLAKTIRVYKTDDGWDIEIPAEIYDMRKWFEEGAVVYTGEGSYASQLDLEGSAFAVWRNGKRYWVAPRNHRDYLPSAVINAVSDWCRKRRGEYTIL